MVCPSLIPSQAVERLFTKLITSLGIAGIPMEHVRGSKTGVYAGSISDDYRQLTTRDSENLPKYAATGVCINMLSNPISWFYDFTGPSITMDSACSSSLMAFDLACQGLRNRDCNMVRKSNASCQMHKNMTELTQRAAGLGIGSRFKSCCCARDGCVAD